MSKSSGRFSQAKRKPANKTTTAADNETTEVDKNNNNNSNNDANEADSKKSSDTGKKQKLVGDAANNVTAANWNEINKILGIKLPDSRYKPATEEEIQEAQDEMEIPIPDYIKALWRIQDGHNSTDHPIFFFPSIKDALQLFSYNDMFPSLFKQLKWFPYQEIDSDMCWNAIDIKSGIICQPVLECPDEEFHVSPGVEKKIEVYLDLLRKKKKEVDGKEGNNDSNNNGDKKYAISEDELNSALEEINVKSNKKTIHKKFTSIYEKVTQELY